MNRVARIRLVVKEIYNLFLLTFYFITTGIFFLSFFSNFFVKLSVSLVFESDLDQVAYPAQNSEAPVAYDHQP